MMKIGRSVWHHGIRQSNRRGNIPLRLHSKLTFYSERMFSSIDRHTANGIQVCYMPCARLFGIAKGIGTLGTSAKQADYLSLAQPPLSAFIADLVVFPCFYNFVPRH